MVSTEILRKLLVAGAAVAALTRRDAHGPLGLIVPADTTPSGPQGTEAALSAPDEPLPQTPSGRDQ